jgi:5-(carboxyamino)imidazole ribonucleotide synthase
MNILSKKIGIIGGGQLGKMMILDAKRLGFYCVTLDPAHHCPSHSISDEHIEAPFDDRGALLELANKVDVITYEFEHIDALFLNELEKKGHSIYPSPKSLLQIKDKFVQKEKLKEANIPVPDYIKVNKRDDIENYVKDHGFKGMLKARLGGYDGKGNALIQSRADIDTAYISLGSGDIPLMIEAFVPFIKEISVLACRGIHGQVSIYPVGENHHIHSILDETIVPARISPLAYKKALEITKEVMEVFDGVGMFCVELFVTKEDEVFVNEVAPRPHNSGHYTIEGCMTSQFEQHIRAITGLPFGRSDLREPTVMKNLLGEVGYSGKTLVEGLESAYKDPDIKIHLYGKSETKEYRKMGHLTVCSKTTEDALNKARIAFSQIKIISQKGTI